MHVARTAFVVGILVSDPPRQTHTRPERGRQLVGPSLHYRADFLHRGRAAFAGSHQSPFADVESMIRLGACSLGALVVPLLIAGPGCTRRDDLRKAQVSPPQEEAPDRARQSLQKGIDWLVRQQSPDHGWHSAT